MPVVGIAKHIGSPFIAANNDIAAIGLVVIYIELVAVAGESQLWRLAGSLFSSRLCLIDFAKELLGLRLRFLLTYLLGFC